MFKKFFKKNKVNESNFDQKSILVSALLIHAAKIDDAYTQNEKNIIKQALINLKTTKPDKVDELLIEAEKKEQQSNQIVEYTKEIKKNPMEFRFKIIEILWKIVYSDGTSGNYESNLIRRVCGLLYVSDRDSGVIKLKVKNSIK